MILGCVLAGGQSTRFGSDKALAELNGQTLLTRAVDALSGWCEQVVVAGRETAPAPTLPDWPHPQMGPLAGIAAALHLALDEGYQAVLTCGVDSAGLPEDLLERLNPGPSYVSGQPVIGLWPASASARLDALLESTGRHSMLAFAELLHARAVELPVSPTNINTLNDLKAAEHNDGL
jgi:molybdopterin-guanine dinucleotide biosynthesis protein A